MNYFSDNKRIKHSNFSSLFCLIDLDQIIYFFGVFRPTRKIFTRYYCSLTDEGYYCEMGHPFIMAISWDHGTLYN